MEDNNNIKTIVIAIGYNYESKKIKESKKFSEDNKGDVELLESFEKKFNINNTINSLQKKSGQDLYKICKLLKINIEEKDITETKKAKLKVIKNNLDNYKELIRKKLEDLNVIKEKRKEIDPYLEESNQEIVNSVKKLKKKLKEKYGENIEVIDYLDFRENRLKEQDSKYNSLEEIIIVTHNGLNSKDVCIEKEIMETKENIVKNISEFCRVNGINKDKILVTLYACQAYKQYKELFDTKGIKNLKASDKFLTPNTTENYKFSNEETKNFLKNNSSTRKEPIITVDLFKILDQKYNDLDELFKKIKDIYNTMNKPEQTNLTEVAKPEEAKEQTNLAEVAKPEEVKEQTNLAEVAKPEEVKEQTNLAEVAKPEELNEENTAIKQLKLLEQIFVEIDNPQQKIQQGK